MKKLLIIILLMSTQCYSQEITVRKKYLDSVKNQLAIYITSTYSLMNSQEQCLNEKEKLTVTLDEVNMSYLKYKKHSTTLTVMLTFISLFLGGIIVLKNR